MEDFPLTSIWYFDIDAALLQQALYCDNSRCNWENSWSWLHPLPKWKNKLRWEDGASNERVGECTGDRDPCFALSVLRGELCISSHCAAIFLLNSNIKTAEVSPALCCWGSSQHLERNMDCNLNQCPTQGLWGTFFPSICIFWSWPNAQIPSRSFIFDHSCFIWINFVQKLQKESTQHFQIKSGDLHSWFPTEHF